MNRKSTKFSFTGNRGQKLSGFLELPEDEPLFYGVFAPCFTCTKESHAAHKICRALAERGMAMLRFDHTGLGDSEGDFSDTNFSSRIFDIIAAFHAVAEEYQPPMLLIGHSISGTAALAAAQHLPQLQALATLGAPHSPKHIYDSLKKHDLIVFGDDHVELTIAGRKITMKKSFIEDIVSYPIAAEVAKYGRKLFIFHAPHDQTVSYENAKTLYAQATAPDKELLSLSETATHLLETGHEDAVFIAETIRSWFDTHP